MSYIKSFAASLSKVGSALVLAICLLFAGYALANSEKAYADDEYTYTVTVTSGNQGTLNNTGVAVESSSAKIIYSPSMIVVRDLHYGDRINFDTSISNLGSDSIYYAKGVRASGLDNETIESMLASVEVTSDMDFVVAYGLKGQLVNYTVKFVDKEGNTLADDQVYIGNVGDSPVVAHLYIDGYRPQAYNLTGKLSENPSDNVFVFEYDQVSQPQNENPTGEPTDQSPSSSSSASSNGQAAPGAPAGQGGADGQGGNGAGADGADDGQPQDGNGEDGGDVTADEPQEVIDIDDNSNPLASGDSDAPDLTSLLFDESGQIVVPLIVTAAFIVVGAALLIAMILTRRRSKKVEEDAVKPSA